MFSLLWHEIKSRRNAIIGWGIGLTFFGLMYTTIYPQVQEEMAGLADLAIYQAMGIEIATFEGYFGSTVIGFVPVLLGVYAVLTATTALAGEEDNGTLELLLTSRMKRWEIVMAKALGLMGVMGIILVITGISYVFGFTLVMDQIETEVTQGAVFVVVFSALPLVWVFVALGLFLGTVTPTRKTAMGIGLVVLIASYFMENLGSMLAELEFVQSLSLFTYFNSSSTVFAEGVAMGDMVLLLVLTGVFLGLAVVGFQRRDVTVGQWPWQKVRV
ncbi:MAG TPA: ABC transporter permease subunit [Anaerolineae bacterium]|nr:ABC transporter permease subunit [Anaerolineae bacterium]